MIADNCCRKSSNRPLVAVVATGETAGVGQTAKNPVRACVFRFAAVTPNGAVGLPHIAFLDTLRLIVRPLLPSSEEQDGSRPGGPQE
jgi:hypothetical protein